MSKHVVEGLLAAGWTSATPRPGAQLRVVWPRRDGSRLTVELRGDQLWLAVDEPGDRRVFGIEPSAEPAAVVAAIVALQDTLAIANYFSAYGDLGEVGAVSIIAWEQFDPDWS